MYSGNNGIKGAGKMIAGKVIDNIWATRKSDSLKGLKFMLIEAIGARNLASIS